MRKSGCSRNVFEVRICDIRLLLRMITGRWIDTRNLKNEFLQSNLLKETKSLSNYHFDNSRNNSNLLLDSSYRKLWNASIFEGYLRTGYLNKTVRKNLWIGKILDGLFVIGRPLYTFNYLAVKFKSFLNLFLRQYLSVKAFQMDGDFWIHHNIHLKCYFWNFKDFCRLQKF